MTSEQLLGRISAAKQGDRSAFAELVSSHQGLVSSTTLSITGDFQRSEDLAQETFLIAWRKLADLKEPLKFPAWLCGIARNCAHNWLRHHVTDPLAKSTTFENVAVESQQTEIDHDEAQLVWSALEKIPENYREPLIMYYRQNAQIAQIAAALEITEETVRQRLSRGRKLLKSEVEQTVAKTLTFTRPDTAFMLTVLAAIPISTTVGCSSTGKTLGLFGGTAVFGSGGFGSLIVAVITFITLILISLISTLIFALAALFALWIAIKQSPTLRTRRYLIGAALDFNLLYIGIYTFIVVAGILFSAIMSVMRLELPFLSSINFQYYSVIEHTIILSALTWFIVHVAIRYQKILYEDRFALENGNTTLPEKTPNDEKPNKYGFYESELRLPKQICGPIANLFTFLETSQGLKLKRNFTILGIVSMIIAYRMISSFVDSYAMIEPNMRYLLIIGWIIDSAIIVAIQAGLFYVVSKGIEISETQAGLNETPPGKPLSDWNIEELNPAARNKFVKTVLSLLFFGPFICWASIIAIELYPFQNPNFCVSLQLQLMIRNICMFTVLTVAAVLWGTQRSNRRFTTYALLFLIIGIWMFIAMEWDPFWMNPTIQKWISPIYFETTTEFSFIRYHICAGFCLIFYGLIAEVCFFKAIITPQNETQQE